MASCTAISSRTGELSARRTLAIGVAGASVTALISGVVLGVSAEDAEDARALEANIAFGIAAVAAIGAAVLWLTGAPDRTTSTRISVVPTAASGASLFIEGRF